MPITPSVAFMPCGSGYDDESLGTVREFKRLAPILATVIMHFEDETTWTLEDLSVRQFCGLVPS